MEHDPVHYSYSELFYVFRHDLLRVLWNMILYITVTQNCFMFSDNVPCKQVNFVDSSFVCVCNSTYCDTVEPNSKVINGYAVYTSTQDGLRLNRTTGTFTSSPSSKGKSIHPHSMDYDLTEQLAHLHLLRLARVSILFALNDIKKLYVHCKYLHIPE